MKYPEFIKKGGTIGICAPSAGVGKKIEDFERSVSFLENLGYDIHETEKARIFCERGGDAPTRGNELNSLFADDSVDVVMCAAGGDFLDEMIPYADFDLMKQHPKWLYGMSDPTGLLFPYTTMCDVATIYGTNAGSYDIDPLPEYLQGQLTYLTGECLLQHSWHCHVSDPFADELHMSEETYFGRNIDSLHVSGRCIGGCVDVLKDLIGTRFDHARDFVERYSEDGTIWYFDNFCLSAECLYRTFLQFRYAGWFEHTKAVIVSRTAIPSSETGMSYEEAIERAFKDIPVIYNADLGHMPPTMAMINGAIMNLDFEENEYKISFQMK